MSSKIETISSTKAYLNQIDKVKEVINSFDTIIIGAGAGLSTSAGFTYSGERFDKYFSDFKNKYKFNDMYSGAFYPYETLEEFWGFWSRNIYVNRYLNPSKPVYDNLYKLVKDKNYFVITTNVDHCFQKAGFDKLRLFYTQGDYGLFQCSKPCHNKTYDNEDIVKEMLAKQKDMKIPSYLIPKCPKCGLPMTTNLRADMNFVEDEGWHKAAKRYTSFIQEHKNKDILFLELGVGSNTPSIIKYPFWQMTYENPKAIYICINLTEAVCPKEIKKQSILIQDDIGNILERLID